jgi:acetylornithine deacetylase/succinyl-diaminopimelate desuccinylase-like protein
LTASVTRPLTWLIRRLWSSGYSGSFWSIPIVALFEKELKAKQLMGFGLDSDAIHSPNEHFGIFNYLKGNYCFTNILLS